jgi:cell division protein FtsB
MGLLYEAKRNAGNILIPVILLAMVGYFTYHLLNGERGLISLVQLNQQVEDARVTAQRFDGERKALEAQVALLRPEHIDPDMLDERARFTLNVGRIDEVVILDRP